MGQLSFPFWILGSGISLKWVFSGSIGDSPSFKIGALDILLPQLPTVRVLGYIPTILQYDTTQLY
jgi:hypothetical protein